MLARALAIACLLAAALAAQTGPFAAGEVLLHNPNGGLDQRLRIDPTTGQTALLAEPTYWGGWADSLEYDPHRGGLIAVMSFGQDSLFDYRPWLVLADGSAVALPGNEGQIVHGLAPASDGRLSFRRRALGNTDIEFYDAGNPIHLLMDETGAPPAAPAYAPNELRTFSIVIDQVAGGANGLLFVGVSHTAVIPLDLTVGGTPGSADEGQLNLPVTLTDPVLSGLEIVRQTGFADAAGPFGASLSNALRVMGL